MKNNNFLVLGNGFLGSRFASNHNYQLISRADGFDVNLSDVEGSITHLVDKFNLSQYDAVVNCMGNSDTRWCESPENWDDAMAMNGQIPKYLSMALKTTNIPFVHISTGCVYDRNDEAQTEESNIVSHCRYVSTKLIGEYSLHDHDLIIRPRLFFDHTQHPKNLLTKMLGYQRFITQQNSYTSLDLVVDAVTTLIENQCTGVFNVAHTGTSSLDRIYKQYTGKRPKTMSVDTLIGNEQLVLVNNILNTDKLEQYMDVPHIDEIIDMYKKIHK